MATIWVPSPRQAPNRCFLTGLSSREHGPYLEVDSPPGRPYIDPVTRREGRMYWSFVSWRQTVAGPDSPYRVILDEEVARRTQELTDEISRLKDELASDPVRTAFAKFHERVNSAERQQRVEAVSQEPVMVPADPPDTPRPQQRHQGKRR